jgi:hypothetical protein
VMRWQRGDLLFERRIGGVPHKAKLWVFIKAMYFFIKLPPSVLDHTCVFCDGSGILSVSPVSKRKSYCFCMYLNFLCMIMYI